MSRTKKSVVQKVQEEMPEFAAEVNTLSIDQINARLAQCAKDSEAIQKAKEEDEDLKAARDEANSMAAGYTDSQKIVRLRAKYLIHVLGERGGA